MNPILLELSKCASIFALAFFSFWPAIPAGLALGLSPLTVITVTTLSYSSGVGIVLFFGGGIRARIMKRLNQGSFTSSDGRLRRIWERFGITGLGLAAPMTVGAQIGAAFGIVLNASPRRLYLAMSLGALAWSVALTAACVLGIIGIHAVNS
ncbi:MAG TPA: hypothetical protein VHL11_00150 [Phototrophicaceae bacterium]|jgi:hypothetical protein|nr:hypothetical protein [Phototrophicaceae bacterium]